MQTIELLTDEETTTYNNEADSLNSSWFDRKASLSTTHRTVNGSLLFQPVPTDVGATPLEQIAILHELSLPNRKLLESLIQTIDTTFSSWSSVSLKDYKEVFKKIKRPKFQEKYPDQGVAAIRDYLRAQIIVQNLDQIIPILEKVFTDTRIKCIKADTAKMINPSSSGWRYAAFDLCMPNGQIVELYMLPKEIQWAKRAKGHQVYCKTRNQLEGIQASQAEGREAYELAWHDYVTRDGRSNEEIKSLWLEVEDAICSNFLNSQQVANSR